MGIAKVSLFIVLLAGWLFSSAAGFYIVDKFFFFEILKSGVNSWWTLIFFVSFPRVLHSLVFVGGALVGYKLMFGIAKNSNKKLMIIFLTIFLLFFILIFPGKTLYINNPPPDLISATYVYDRLDDCSMIGCSDGTWARFKSSASSTELLSFYDFDAANKKHLNLTDSRKDEYVLYFGKGNEVRISQIVNTKNYYITIYMRSL